MEVKAAPFALYTYPKTGPEAALVSKASTD